MNAQMKQDMQKLNELGYKVDFFYIIDDKYYFQANAINPNFKETAIIECMISKETYTDTYKKYQGTYHKEDIQYFGRSYCNPADKFIPRIGKAIAFKRALALVPEFKDK